MCHCKRIVDPSCFKHKSGVFNLIKRHYDMYIEYYLNLIDSNSNEYVNYKVNAFVNTYKDEIILTIRKQQNPPVAFTTHGMMFAPEIKPDFFCSACGILVFTWVQLEDIKELSRISSKAVINYLLKIGFTTYVEN